MIQRNLKYRLYPSKKLQKNLGFHLNSCRKLYNNLLYLEKITYALDEKFIFEYDLYKIIKKEKNIFSQVKRTVAKRLEDSLTTFIKERKNGRGFPRFKGKYHYKSWTYLQSGFKLLEKDKLFLSKIGNIKINLHRKIEGKIKTCTIKKENDKWFVIFSVEKELIVKKRKDNKSVGLDLGCKDFFTLSDGTTVENPHFLRKSIGLLSNLQSIKDKTKNSRKKNKLARKISSLHQKIKNQREDFLHKQSRKLAENYRTIVVEKLNIKNMLDKKTSLKTVRKSILDSGWNSFINKLTYKVEETGSKLIKVNPKNTSKICSFCGEIKEDLELKDRVYNCSKCNQIIDRDLNASKNILRFGMESLDENPRCHGL